MAGTITWGILRGTLSLAFAVAVVSKADSDFEAVAFLAALIAYHRIGLMLAAEALAALKRGVRLELWLHRADALAGSGQVVGTLPAVLRDVPLYHADLFQPGQELEELNNELALIEKKSHVNTIVAIVIEVCLIGAVLFVLAS